MAVILFVILFMFWWPFLCLGFPRWAHKKALTPTETRLLSVFAWIWGLASFRLIADGHYGLVSFVGGAILSTAVILLFWRPSHLKNTFELMAHRLGMTRGPIALLSGGHPELRSNALNPIARAYSSYTAHGIRYTIEPVVGARKRYKYLLYRLGIRVPGIPYDISLLPSLWRGSKPLAAEIRELHPAFQFVSGSGASALAIMSSAEILDAVEEHFGDRRPKGFRGEGPTLIGGTIELTVRANTHELERGLDVLSKLAEKLHPRDKTVPQLLVKNLDHSDPAFQRLSFNALLTIYADVQNKLDLLKRGLAHGNDDIRITAATHLPREAFDELTWFVESGKPRHQARAMAVVRENYPWHRFRELAETALESDNESLVAEAIRAHGTSNDPSLVAVIVPFLGGDSILARASVEALRALGPSAEPHLITALQRPEVEIVEAVVYALQEIGGRDSVVALTQLEQRNDLPHALRKEAIVAAETIKSGLTGDHGRLSLTEIGVSEGQLSVAEDEGALSVAEHGGETEAEQKVAEERSVEET